MNDSASADNTQRQSVRPAVVFLVMAAIVLVAVAALVLWQLKSTRRLYTAKAMLMVTPVRQADTIDPLLETDHTEGLHLESARIMSDENLTEVLKRQDVQATQWYGQYSTNEDALAALRAAVTAEPVQGTFVLAVSASAQQPQDAALLANVVVEKYLNHHAPRDEELGDSSRSHSMLVRLGSWARPPKRPD